MNPVTEARPALTGRAAAASPHWPVFLGLAVSIPVVDQLVKSWITATFAVGEPVEIVGDWLRIGITHNTGALFGLFRDSAPVFALVSVVVIGLIVWYHGRSGRSLVLSIALGLLLGGAIGNFVDRLRLGYVVDFVDMGVGTWRFYTYNVADAAITTAILLLLLLALLPGLSARGEDA